MPRPRRPGAPEPKRRSRKGCWPCKARKVKCVQSAQFFFALSPPDVQLDSTDVTPPIDTLDTTEGSNVQEQAMENLFWEPEFVSETMAETPIPRGLHDIHESPSVPEQTSRPPYRTNDKTPVELSPPSRGRDVATSWPAMSQAPLSSETIPDHPPSFASPLDALAYQSPADTGSSTGSLGILNWSPATVSQPISFLRQSADISKQSVRQLPVEQDSHRLTKWYDGHLIGVPGPDVTDSLPSRDGFPLSASSQRDPALLSNVPVSAEDFCTTTMNEPLRSLKDGTSDHYGVDATQYPRERAVLGPGGPTPSQRKWYTYLTSVTDNYGLDCGHPDRDLNQNDDHSAIDINSALNLVNQPGESLSDTAAPGSPEKEAKASCFDCNYAYYKSAVPINIPRYLSPLPATLVQTPINLMYFHHFLNHTARMLVPHDCGNNPFITVLPSMAVGDSNLLNLMLAYSASHRARYLKHPEPANRIAHWVSSVFPALRLALEDAHKKTTDNHLAAAIMLLSLKIVSPSTFEVPIPWQSHLKLARDLFLARREQMVYPGNRVGAFLIRWLGYLDIMGTLSCRHSEPPLLAYFSSLNTCCIGEKYDEYSADCFTGFTPRTGLFLMRLGQLVHQCDNERFDETGAFILEWTPSADIIFEAQTLLADLDILNMHTHANGRHFQDSMSTDIVAMDQAFRYAGLVHLQCRVLGASSSSPALKKALEELAKSLVLIRSGSPVEVGSIFPLFTVGCEFRDLEQRTEIQARFKRLESTGLKQIQNARTLMQKCWKEDRPWIALAQGEFLG
ncbi:Zn(II)2Cys6 transcription factor [Aspergillus affinis]|uniref:Zn(II)2Cys6 transcription factor n=1 Tax=Aspergillus affinis TaxID=1070780 RepID=UPI0022FE733F|nr:C6 zinc finger domain protein [Aspergillus affinis]KAI9038324.1 C6 zinc finger domain protein [Aspergillus affinis]